MAVNNPPGPSWEKFFSVHLAQNESDRAMIGLYADPVFCRAVSTLQRLYPPHQVLKILKDEMEKRKVLRARLRMVLSRWGLDRFPHNATQSYRWLYWLWRRWNPESRERPQLPLGIQEPSLAHWTLHHLEHPLNFAAEKDFHQPYRNAWVSLTLFPGVSRKQVVQGALAACEMVNAPWQGDPPDRRRGGRPSALSHMNRALLLKLFEVVGVPEPRAGQRQADKLRRLDTMRASCSTNTEFQPLGPLSRSTIAKHYREWLATKGCTPRRYHSDKPTTKSINN